MICTSSPEVLQTRTANVSAPLDTPGEGLGAEAFGACTTQNIGELLGGVGKSGGGAGWFGFLGEEGRGSRDQEDGGS